MSTAGPAAALGLPFDAEAAFTDAKGRRSKRLEKTQARALKKIAPVLGHYLEEGERILVATRACSPSSPRWPGCSPSRSW